MSGKLLGYARVELCDMPLERTQYSDQHLRLEHGWNDGCGVLGERLGLSDLPEAGLDQLRRALCRK